MRELAARWGWLVLAILVCWGTSLSPAMAAEGWTLDMAAALNSKYVWRGQVVVDDWVVQPSLTASRGGLSLNFWGNYEPTDETGHRRRFTEVDLTAEYAFSWGQFTVPVGVIHYLFPNTATPATTELYAGVSYDWLVSPSLTVYYDADQAPGAVYLALSAGYAHPLWRSGDVEVGLELGAGVAYANAEYLKAYFGVDQAGWSDWYASLGVPVRIPAGSWVVTLTPAVTHTALLDSQVRDAAAQDSSTFFGLTAGLSF
jgi:hypothetical protein